MFSNTAYEALYQYIGLELHGRFIEILTSQSVFMATILLLFGFMFFSTSVKFFSRYIPGTLIKRESVPLSRYVKIVACLFLGISLLKIGANTSIKDFKRHSWHENQYVKSQSRTVKPEYRVSFIFDLLSRSAEEAAALVNHVIDEVFKTTHSELEAPGFFYKAIMFAGSATIKDEELRSKIDFYANECIERVLPLIGGQDGLNRLDAVFDKEGLIDQKLDSLVIKMPGPTHYTCLNAKNEVREHLLKYAKAETGDFPTLIRSYLIHGPLDEKTTVNMQMSSALVDYFLESRESLLGIQKGSQPATTGAKIYQYLNKIFSWDALTSLVAGREGQGATLSAKRAQEFSENLTRAPHLAGFIKMALIAGFPWLIFAVVAGYWKVLVYWFLVYLSVLLWAPIWTLFYHVSLNIALSADVMAAFGKLSDGISLYSSSLITSRMNYLFAVYSWIQVLIGPGFTAVFIWIVKPLLSDTEQPESPEFISNSSKAAGTAAGVASGVGRLL